MKLVLKSTLHIRVDLKCMVTNKVVLVLYKDWDNKNYGITDINIVILYKFSCQLCVLLLVCTCLIYNLDTFNCIVLLK